MTFKDLIDDPDITDIRFRAHNDISIQYSDKVKKSGIVLDDFPTKESYEEYFLDMLNRHSTEKLDDYVVIKFFDDSFESFRLWVVINSMGVFTGISDEHFVLVRKLPYLEQAPRRTQEEPSVCL